MNITPQTSGLHNYNLLLYKCEVNKLESKAGNFLSGKRGGGEERQTERKRERNRQRQQDIKRKRES